MRTRLRLRTEKVARSDRTIKLKASVLNGIASFLVINRSTPLIRSHNPRNSFHFAPAALMLVVLFKPETRLRRLQGNTFGKPSHVYTCFLRLPVAEAKPVSHTGSPRSSCSIRAWLLLATMTIVLVDVSEIAF